MEKNKNFIVTEEEIDDNKPSLEMLYDIKNLVTNLTRSSKRIKLN